MSSGMVGEAKKFALVSTYALADRHDDAKGKRTTDLVYFGMQNKGTHVVRYSFFRVFLVYNNPREKDLTTVT